MRQPFPSFSVGCRFQSSYFFCFEMEIIDRIWQQNKLTLDLYSHKKSRSVFKTIEDLIDTLRQFQKCLKYGIFLLLVELLKIIIDAIGISIRKDIPHKDDHIIMMYDENELPVPFLLDVCEVVLLTAVELNLIFYEVDHLYEATLHFEEELLLEEDGFLEVLFVETVDLVLFASLFEGLALLFRHLWLFVGFFIIFDLQHVIPHKIVVLLHIRDSVQYFGIKYLTNRHSLKFIFDLLHEINYVLLQPITDEVLHNGEFHLILDAVRHLELVGLPQYLFQEIYFEFLVQDLEEYGHECFDDRVFLEIATGETSEIEVVIAIKYVQVKLFWDGAVKDLGTVLILDVASYGSPEHHTFFIFLFFDLIKNRMVEELMPVDPCLFGILQHASDQLHQIVGDLHVAGRHLVLKLETHLKEFILAELILKREGEVNHPIQGNTKRVNIAFVCISLLESYLR